MFVFVSILLNVFISILLNMLFSINTPLFLYSPFKINLTVTEYTIRYNLTVNLKTDIKNYYKFKINNRFV